MSLALLLITVAARHGPIPFSFHRTASGEKVTKHGTCALTDDIGGLTKSALVAAIKAKLLDVCRSAPVCRKEQLDLCHKLDVINMMLRSAFSS